ncbi:2-hydroxyacid dehydrogenase [Amycolatopsis sp. GM8]|uniref:2-hydroxyacid dehydrogenase n=1 Tax=Amycolatopsis sp. GM8 TaxID=2896530 RepID=UPI001F4495B7|nr:2-hydroxyacid dehydrogenase [Amycolatopsis sp. GM8]
MSLVLQVGALPQWLTGALRDEYRALVLPDDGERDAFLAGPGRDVRVAATSVATGVSRELILALPSLEAVVNYGAGYETTDVHAAIERGVVVSNTPDVLSDCVADTALGLTIDVLRGLSAGDRFVRRGDWADGAFPLMRKVSGARVGILGLGRIGRAIATRFQALGCTISYHDRREFEDSPFAYASSPVELAAGADVLIVAAAGGPATHHLVDQAVLEALGTTGYLINIARGSLVDEEALVKVLMEGGIAGAGLDVFAHEPHVPPELLTLDNVVLSPHLASGTVETRAAMEEVAMANVRAYMTEGRLLTPVPEMQRAAG